MTIEARMLCRHTHALLILSLMVLRKHNMFLFAIN